MTAIRAAFEAARVQVSSYLSAHGYLPADACSSDDLFRLTDDLANRFFSGRERDAEFWDLLRAQPLNQNQIDEIASAANERLVPSLRAGYIFGLAVDIRLRYLHGELR